MMSPVSVSPVQTDDLDLVIPPFPKESVVEDPAADSEEDANLNENDGE